MIMENSPPKMDLEEERDSYRSALCDLVAASHRFKNDPKFRTAFLKARTILKFGPSIDLNTCSCECSECRLGHHCQNSTIHYCPGK